ncbi:hypothetical protein [Aureimonas sp. ME7]|uniref:hypothetical protein n=1 Tax=Aureimonas sp. ME7 TaxID=2744252 RepID=UPI0015F5DED4|nr:hypothetical protein [Aureimonas sp. ME7]
MDQTKTCTPTSKREVAFRFVACTGIALALYYTPELRWSADQSASSSVQADTLLRMPAPEQTIDTCAARDERGLLDVASKAE